MTNTLKPQAVLQGNGLGIHGRKKLEVLFLSLLKVM
jgi:hypothetical protein